LFLTAVFLQLFGTGSWMLCLCTNWFWENPCICMSNAYEA